MSGVKKIKQSISGIPVYNLEGKEEKHVDLSKEITESKINSRLLTQSIRAYSINQRQGTASVKTRGEVIGSTRKIYKQKGTGRARHGDIKAPIFVGGGVVGGPQPRDFSLKLNKKQKKKTLIDSLAYKYKEGDILGLVSEAINLEPKTKIFINFLKNSKLSDKKILLVLPARQEKNLVYAVRNIPKVTTSQVDSLNPYLILNNQKIIFLESALISLINHFLKKNEN